MTIKQVIIHELGHLAACCELGVAVERVEIAEKLGCVIFTNDDEQDRLKRATIAISGPIAEVSFLGGSIEEVKDVFTERSKLRRYGVSIANNERHSVASWHRDYNDFWKRELTTDETQQAFDHATEIFRKSNQQIDEASQTLLEKLKSETSEVVLKFCETEVRFRRTS